MDIPESTRTEVQQLLAAGQKLEAIKLIQQQLSLSLGDAVTVAEAIQRGETTVNVAPKLAAARPFGSSTAGRRGGLWIFILVFSLVGAILGGVGLWLYSSERSFRERATAVEGVVVENIREGRGFRPVFEFAWKGETKRAEMNFSSSTNNRPVYKTNEKVSLLVEPEDPNIVHVNSWFGSWFAATILGGMGFIFFGIGFGTWFFTRARRQA